MSEIRIPIRSDGDIITARQMGRVLAEQMGFHSSDATVIATAISEIACNIVEHAKRGEISVGPITQGSRQGIIVVARDSGPGISDIDLAMKDGYSTSKGIGLGLPGARLLMDEFDIKSKIGSGTIVTMKKWLPWTGEQREVS